MAPFACIPSVLLLKGFEIGPGSVDYLVPFDHKRLHQKVRNHARVCPVKTGTMEKGWLNLMPQSGSPGETFVGGLP
jgi:hypothetical protein